MLDSFSYHQHQSCYSKLLYWNFLKLKVDRPWQENWKFFSRLTDTVSNCFVRLIPDEYQLSPRCSSPPANPRERPTLTNSVRDSCRNEVSVDRVINGTWGVSNSAERQRSDSLSSAHTHLFADGQSLYWSVKQAGGYVTCLWIIWESTCMIHRSGYIGRTQASGIGVGSVRGGGLLIWGIFPHCFHLLIGCTVGMLSV